MTWTIPLQISDAGIELLNYGVLGIVVVGLAFFSWHQYSRHEKNSEDYKKKAEDSNSKLMDLSYKSLAIQERQNELYEKVLQQQKEYHDSVHQKVDEIPDKVVKELELKDLKNKVHGGATPTGT